MSEKMREKKKPNRGTGTVQRIKEFKLYAIFLSLTMEERNLKFGGHTGTYFAKKYKLSPDTLTVWNRRPDLWELRDKAMINLKQFTIHMLEGIRNNVIAKGDAAGMKIWLQFVEKWTEKTEIGIDKINEAINEDIEKYYRYR